MRLKTDEVQDEMRLKTDEFQDEMRLKTDEVQDESVLLMWMSVYTFPNFVKFFYVSIVNSEICFWVI